jgi:hypothetical protein
MDFLSTCVYTTIHMDERVTMQGAWSPMVRVGIAGAAGGLGLWLAATLVLRGIIGPLFCKVDSAFAVCSNGGYIAELTATLIMSVVMVSALMRLAVFRPLLVVLIVNFALFGLFQKASQLPIVESVLWCMAAYAVAYVLGAWVASGKRFWLVVVLGAVVAASTRLILS